jgi:hypothetical protein
MARYRYSPAPSAHSSDEIDVTTIPVPDQWRDRRLASGGTPGRVALTDPALVVDALARRRVASLPEELSPYGMVALLDAPWDREQPWRELVEQARVASTAELLARLDQAQASQEPPLELEVATELLPARRAAVHDWQTQQPGREGPPGRERLDCCP